MEKDLPNSTYLNAFADLHLMDRKLIFLFSS